ncbi:hypothetical protein BX666DRAFT_975216 [Dichotomocladium elegans]|nr:hypothetical protein BX666DRAFT_975216 [Dichotomocladium elegans]
MISYDDYVINESPRVKRANTNKEPSPPKERRNSSVMSIDFICGNESVAEVKPANPVDILCNVAVDADYMDESTSKTVPMTLDHKDPNTMSSPLCSSSMSSMSEDGLSDSKADSGVELSPRQWKDDESMNNDTSDGLVDYQPGLTTVEATTIPSIDSASTQQHTKPRKGESNKKNSKDDDEGLRCVACNCELRKEDISEQVGCDTMIAADLVTWTWTPSAIFTDWHPERCPRCERHYIIFRQEWPHRKIKKKEATKIIPEKLCSEKRSKPQLQPPSKKITATSKPKKGPKAPSPGNNRLDKATEEYLCRLFCRDDIQDPLSDFEGDEDELSFI